MAIANLIVEHWNWDAVLVAVIVGGVGLLGLMHFTSWFFAQFVEWVRDLRRSWRKLRDPLERV
jgi:hypothetical protein